MTRRAFLSLPIAAKAAAAQDAEDRRKIAEIDAMLNSLWNEYTLKPEAIYTPEGRLTKDGLEPWGTFYEPFPQ